MMKQQNKKSRPDKRILKPEKQHLPAILWVAALVIAVLTYISFSPSLRCGFTNWDDDTYVTQNPLVVSNGIQWQEIFSTPVALNYHPITVLSLAVNYKAAQLNPLPYHLFNLFIHLANTLLVFFFIYFLTGKKILTAAITSILFGIHPMHAESVTWISERKDVLYVFFFLAALLTYLQYVFTRKSSFLIICFILFVLSCMSKAMAVVLPLVLLLTDYYSGIKIERKTVLEKIPFFIVSLVFGIIALNIQSGSANADVQSFGLFQRILFGCYGFVIYLVKFILPINLSAFYPYPDHTQELPWVFFTIPVLIAAATFFVYLFFRDQRFMIFGFLFFIVTIALVLQFISVGNALMADRYTYLSYIGLAFIVGNIYERLILRYPRSGLFLNFLMIAWIGWFCLLTYNRVQVWTNSETLWTDVIKKYPACTIAYKNRGNYYGQHGKAEEALNDYKVLLALNTKDPEVFNNLANIYAAQNKIKESLDASSKAIALKPDYVNAYINRGITYHSTRQFSNAISDFSKAISLNPKNSQAYLQRAFSNYASENFQAAVNDFSQALILQPGNGAAYYYRGLSNMQIHNNKQALRDIQEARALGYEGDYTIMNKM